jgi:murein DD-endopeptidase MepM/ murein hydrolase activator NlpD
VSRRTGIGSSRVDAARHAAFGAGLAALLALAPAFAAPVFAQANRDSMEAARQAERQAERDRQLEADKRRELEEIERQARQNREQAGKLQQQEKTEIGKLRRTERSLNSTRKRLGELQNRSRRLDQQLESTKIDLERAEISLASQRAKLARRLRNMYKQGAARELEWLLSTSTIPQVLARWDFLVMVAEQDRLLLDAVAVRKEDVVAAKQKLEVNLTEVQKNENRTAEQRRRLAGLQHERSQTVSRIKTQRQAYEAAAAELEKTARDIKRLLADLEARRKRGTKPYTGDFAKGKGELDWPVRGAVVGTFGPEKHPKWGTTTINNGIDIEAAIGTPVRAVAKARVDYTSEDYGTYGQMIILNHGDGYYTLYGHLSEISVSVGQEVAGGTTIGRVGDTGSLKGAVLHFEVREGGSALDPRGWLR